MARDNDIQIVAGLDIPKSKSTIDKDIPVLEKELQNDKSSRPKLIATLDINKSKKAIQANLDTLTSKTDAPKIKVGIDVGGADVKKIQKDISQQVNKAIPTKIGSNLVDSFMSEFSIVGKKAKEIKGDVAGLLSEFNDGFNAKDSEKYYNSLKKIFDLIAQNTQTYSKPTKDIKREIDNYMANALEGSPAFIDTKTKSDLTTMLGKKGTQNVLSSIFGGGKWTYNKNKSGFVGVDTLINPDIIAQCNGVADALMHIYDAKMMLQRGIDDSPTNLFEVNGIKSQQGALDYVEKRLYSILGLQHQIQTGMVELYSGDDDFVELIGVDDTLDDKSLASRRFSKIFDNNARRTLEQAKSEFKELYNIVDGENGSVSAKWIRDAADNINGLSVEVKKAEGEIETFKYKLSDDRTGFVYTGSSASDKGVAKQVKQLEKDYAKYSKLLAEFRNKNSPIESGLTAPIQEMEAALLGLKNGTKTVDDVSISFNNLEQSASKISKYLETTNKSLDKKNNAVNTYRDFDKTIQQLETNVKNLTLKPAGLDKDVADVKKHISELQALEKSEGGFTENWAKRYHDVNLEVHALKSNIDLAMQAESKSQKADKNSAYQVQLKYLNAIKKENSLILRLKKQIINAGEEEAKVLEHRVDKAYKRIQDKVKQLNKKGLYTDDAKIIYNTGVNDRNDLDELLNAKLADKATKKATADLVKYRTEVDRTITKLNNLFNNTTFKNNSINNEVIEQKNRINGLSTEYQKIKTILQGDINPTGIKSVGAVLRNLKVEFDTVQAETDELKAKLNLSRDLNRMSKDIDILRNRIAIFRSENTKSEKMMGGTFNSLDTRLRDLKALTDSGILDKQAFANISRDFRNAEKEVRKFGLSGKTVFQTLGEQVKKFSSWMSLTYIIASLARSVRGAISELKEINTVLTEISKTSDRTSESLERLGKASFDRASQYGRKASDYLTGVQEMSRAGFGEQESEDMAELSVLAQSAGDMTAELANQYLIATNAGYKLEGNAKRLNSILDSQNFITNRNALNLSELAEATKIVSSQASQAGIGIDEMTAAVGTMIATTQQGGEVASRSFKGRRTIRTIALYGCKSIAA